MKRASASQERSQINAVAANILKVVTTLAALEKRFYVSLTSQRGCT
jgi:hypothetical protein